MVRACRFLILLVALTLTLPALAGGITVRDRSHSVIGYVSDDGVVRNRSTRGYLTVGGLVKTRSHSTAGRINEDGRVQDRHHSTLGRVSEDGVVRNRSHSVVGYVEGASSSDRMLQVAYLFFFSDFLD